MRERESERGMKRDSFSAHAQHELRTIERKKVVRQERESVVVSERKGRILEEERQSLNGTDKVRTIERRGLSNEKEGERERK